MSNSILYYPTIEFRPEDYRWLWSASLLWDKVFGIVPPGYKLNEPRNIKELCSTGEIGIPISPLPYSNEASIEFSDFMANNRSKAAALSLIDSDDLEYIRIHSSKIDEAVSKHRKVLRYSPFTILRRKRQNNSEKSRKKCITSKKRAQE